MSQKYDPSQFIVPPQIGDKGHSQRIQANIQTGQYRAIRILAQSNIFPWRTDAEVIRWCIKNSLDQLSEMEPNLVQSVISRTNQILRQQQEEEFNRHSLESFQKLAETVNFYLMRGDRETAIGEIHEALRTFQSLRAQSDREKRWKRIYIEELAKTFRHVTEIPLDTPVEPVVPPKPLGKVEWDAWDDGDDDADQEEE